MNKIINFNDRIKNFKKYFSFEDLCKMDEETLLDNLFGCDEEYEDTINTNINKTLISTLKEDFQITEDEEVLKDTNLYLTFLTGNAQYRITNSNRTVDYKEAKEICLEIRKIIKDYNFIIERIDKCEFTKGEYFDSAIPNRELCIEKYKNSMKYMNYGLRKLLSIYFPEYILPFRCEEHIFDFFHLYGLSYFEDDFIKKFIQVKKYCHEKNINTFDIAFEYYNSPKYKKLIINIDGLYENLDNFEHKIGNEGLVLRKRFFDNTSKRIKHLNTYPLKVHDNQQCYIAFQDKIRYKCLFKNIENESESSIALKLINLKKIDEKYPKKIDNYIEYIQCNFNEDYLEYTKSNSNFLNVLEIIRNKKVLKNIKIVKGITKCHNLEHKKCEEDIFVIIFNENEVIPEKVSVYFCPICKEYSMLYSDFENLLKKYNDCSLGVHVKNINDFSFNYENKYSLLYLFGYSVSAKNNLSISRRRFLLDMFVEYFWSRDMLINHLEIEKKKRQNITIRDMRSAVSKWEADIDYLKIMHNSENNNESEYFYTYFVNKGD